MIRWEQDFLWTGIESDVVQDYICEAFERVPLPNSFDGDHRWIEKKLCPETIDFETYVNLSPRMTVLGVEECAFRIFKALLA